MCECDVNCGTDSPLPNIALLLLGDDLRKARVDDLDERGVAGADVLDFPRVSLRADRAQRG